MSYQPEGIVMRKGRAIHPMLPFRFTCETCRKPVPDACYSVIVRNRESLYCSKRCAESQKARQHQQDKFLMHGFHRKGKAIRL